MKCLICGDSYKQFNKHLKHIHQLDIKSYYDIYLKKDNEGFCESCGNPTVFHNWRYGRFCSNACISKSKIGKTISEELRQKLRLCAGRKKGCISWNKGKSVPLEVKKKISKSVKKLWENKEYADKQSKAHKGFVKSEETRRRHRESAPKGEDCHFWKGGISFQKYDNNFTKVFKEEIKRRDVVCHLCEQLSELVCHHIDYEKTNTIYENVVALCRSCHGKTNIHREFWEKLIKDSLIDKINMPKTGFYAGIKYHKINSIFKRDEKGKFIIGEYSTPEFEYLANNRWRWDEKIDGTQIRIIYENNKLTFGGKTDNAQIPAKLVSALQDLFSAEKFKEVFPDANNVCLYGEGYGCFHCDTPITLADNSKIRIGKIVNQKKEVEVLSYNFNTDRLEGKKVIGFKKIEDDNGEWITLHVARKKRGGKPPRLIVTKNHNIFVKRDSSIVEIPAEQLIVGDKLLIPSRKLTYFQKQLVLGTLLGDGSLSSFMLHCTHCEKQTDYFLFKTKILNSLVGNVYNTIGGYDTKEKQFYTKVLYEFKDLYDYLYDNNDKKIITEEYLNKLHPFALAIWYMDDGTLNTLPGTRRSTCHLCTDGFSEQNVELLVNYFNKHGYECYKKRCKKYFRVAFTPDGSIAFLSSIAPFIIDFFNYKLLPNLRNIPKIWNNILYDQANVNLLETPIVKIEKGNPYTEKWKRYRYDIEVEDNHNYFANNVLVHNSGIQKGGKYRKDQSFVLFDVLVEDWILKRVDIEDIAFKLGIDIVPIVGYGTLAEAIALTKTGFKSAWGDFIAEGLVLRPETDLFSCSGKKRIITKVKHKDFK